MALGFETSKPTPSDVLLLMRPHLLDLPQNQQQLETKYSTTFAKYSHSNQHTVS